MVVQILTSRHEFDENLDLGDERALVERGVHLHQFLLAEDIPKLEV